MLIPNDVAQSISRGVTFAAYALPGEAQMHLLQEGETFQINKFGTSSDYNDVIRPGIKDTTSTLAMPQSNTMGHDEYLSMVQGVIDNLKGTDEKVVMSRLITGDAKNLDIFAVAEAYLAKFPDTFRCIFAHPLTGLWIVASPELLLYHDKAARKVESCALAGTRPRQESPGPWDAKNIREHNIVRDYITRTFGLLGLQPSCRATVTVPFGPIEHLRTPIEGVMPEDVTFFDVLDRMSPTPALCGYPPAKAQRTILAKEPHERGCYGGYIAVSTSACDIAYVNLRSLQITSGQWRVYVGGGILADSDAESEWQETQAKASTLLHIIEKSTHGTSR